jgi:hypothetical protein
MIGDVPVKFTRHTSQIQFWSINVALTRSVTFPPYVSVHTEGLYDMKVVISCRHGVRHWVVYAGFVDKEVCKDLELENIIVNNFARQKIVGL